MKYVWLLLKIVGYLILAFLLFAQIIAFASSSNLNELLIRGSILLAVGLFFAIKWQKSRKPKDESTQDRPES